MPYRIARSREKRLGAYGGQTAGLDAGRRATATNQALGACGVFGARARFRTAIAPDAGNGTHPSNTRKGYALLPLILAPTASISSFRRLPLKK